MKLIDYLKDQIISILMIIIMTVLVWIILWVFNVNSFLLIYLPLLIIGVFIIVYSYDYLRKRNYYCNFIRCLDALDEKYLVTELVDVPHFLEGKIMIDSIYEIDKAMKEYLNEIASRQKELKEYIEMWCHEVKNPVATSQMIIENNLNPITRSIQEELIKIDDYVEQVLFYARMESVEKDYLIKHTNLQEVVNTVIKRNKKDLISKKIKIELNDLDKEVPSDKKWLEFILHQIINNAIKYVSNQPKIHIYTQTFSDYIELIIYDNGVGIKENELDRVFDKGFTGSNGRNNKQSTGIGLYLCKKLCQKLNHNITINSDKGTIVILTFPISSYVTLH